MDRGQVMAMREFIENFESGGFESGLYDDFEKLKSLTNEIRCYKKKTTNEGERECNRKKNRYRDILPYDESRVILDSPFDNEKTGNDYINASIISSALDGHYKYIAAQGPNKETCLDFIRMLHQYNVKIVICACNEIEGGKTKCHRYWTDKVNESYTFYKNYNVSLKSKPTILDGCVIRELVVRYNSPSSMSESSSNSSLDYNDLKEFEFTQFHITNWPDHGVPENVEPIIKMLNKVRNKMNDSFKISDRKRSNKSMGNKYLAVHCSAGCGRTGTIIAIDQLWTMINENKLTSDFSMYTIAHLLRQQRIAMIQTLSQYILFAKAIVYLFEKKLKAYEDEIANQNMRNLKMSRSNYENINNYENFENYQKELNLIIPSQLPASQSPIYLSPDNHNNTHSNLITPNSLNTSKEQVVLRKKNFNSPNYLKSLRRSYMADTNNNQTNTNLIMMSDEINNNKRDGLHFMPEQMNTKTAKSYMLQNYFNGQNTPELTPNTTTSTTTQNENKRSGFSSVRGNHYNPLLSTSMEGSMTVNSPRIRHRSPYVQNIFNHSQQQQQQTPDSTNPSLNTPNSSSTSSSSSSSSTMSKSKAKTDSTANEAICANSSKFFTNTLTPKEQNLLRRDNNAPQKPISPRDNLKHLVFTPVKVQNSKVNFDCNPRKLFESNPQYPLNNQADQRLPETYSMSGSLYLENSSSTTDACSGTGQIVNKYEKNNSELFINDEALCKKESGSGCEFLSNRLENSRHASNVDESPAHSPSITSLDATASLSSSGNSTAAHTPNTTPNFTAKNRFKIASLAKKSVIKQVKLGKPSKAELITTVNLNGHNGLLKETTNQIDQQHTPSLATSPRINDFTILTENLTDKKYEPEPPKPPMRRNKKSLAKKQDEQLQARVPLRQNLTPDVYQQHKNPLGCVNNNQTIKPNPAIIYRNRSSSSTKYDNHLSDGYPVYQSKSALGKRSDYEPGNVKPRAPVNETNKKNIDMNVIRELQSKKSQIKLKAQKLTEKHLNQTLPSKPYQNSEFTEKIDSQQTCPQHQQIDPITTTTTTNYRSTKSPIKLRHSTNNHTNQIYINQHFYLKNKLYNLTEHNSNKFFESKSKAGSVATNRFEDLYDSPYLSFSNKLTKSEFGYNRNSDLTENKRRSAHLFNL